MFAFGRKHNNSQRFTFGISTAAKIYIGTGANKLEGRWDSGLADNASGQTAAELFPSLFDDGDLKTGTWIHFAVTYADRESTSEGSVARKVYLNGELIRSQNVNWSNTGGSTGGMYFGGRNLNTGTGYNNGWACGLDQVAIFNTAKDADWVTSVYNTDKKKLDLSNESGLVGYWKFNEGSGTTVKDHSGNGNHGTFAAISGDTTAYPTWEYDALLEYRDVDWHEGDNPYPSGGFETFARHIKKKGIPEPLIVTVGKNGQAKISKGNQMLMIAKQMGLKELPVRFTFQDNVQKANKTTADPAIVNRQIQDTQDEDILKRKLR
jgi:hypothetical protein